MSGNISLESSQLSVAETSGSLDVVILRSDDLSQPVTVTYEVLVGTASAADLVPVSGTIIIPAGENSVVVPVSITDDALSEPTETFAFSVISVDSGTLLFPRTLRVDIIDDENPPIDQTEPPLESSYNVQEIELATGLNKPISLEFLPDNPRLAYVAEKGGLIKLIDLASGTVEGVVLDLEAATNDNGDRGLMDIALHPDFQNNPYLYVFNVVDPDDAAGMTGLAGLDGGGNRYAHVTRYTLDEATGYQSIVAGSGQIIAGSAGQSLADISGNGAINSTSDLELADSEFDAETGELRADYIKLDSSSHAGGSMEFGPDGALYIAVGDGTSFNVADPRTVTVQDVNSLSGKVLRVDPLTGNGLPDNPFVSEAGGDLSANAAKVYQLGLRNPFSMSFDEDGKLFLTNTGWFTSEEVNSGGPGANFGWPFYEGGDGGTLIQTPNYKDFPEAQIFYDAVAKGDIVITPSYRSFAHDDNEPGFQLQAITGADDLLSGSKIPDSLQGHYVFADIVQGEVFSVSTDDPTDLQFLYKTDDEFAPAHFKLGPNGELYYVGLLSGEVGIVRIQDQIAQTEFTFQGKTYKVVGQGLNRQDAIAAAEAEGGRLLDINSQAENDFVTQSFWNGQAIYIDRNDVTTEGVWANSDGLVSDYVNWLPGQPDSQGGNQDYARIATADGRWDDDAANSQFVLENGTWLDKVGALAIAEIGDDPDVGTFDGKTYMVLGDDLSRSQATSAALSAGGTLLEVNSQAENDFIVEKFWSGKAIYLDRNDVDTEGFWVNSSGQETAFTNWAPGEPNNYGDGQDFANIASATGLWDDADADAAFVFDGQRWFGSNGAVAIAEIAAPDTETDQAAETFNDPLLL